MHDEMLNSGVVPDDTTYDILVGLKPVEASPADAENPVLNSAS